MERLLRAAAIVSGQRPEDLLARGAQEGGLSGNGLGVDRALPWPLNDIAVDTAGGPSAHVACAVLSYGLSTFGSWDHPWSKARLRRYAFVSHRLPDSDDAAREILEAWLAICPDTTDDLWRVSLKFALAWRWTELRVSLGVLAQALGPGYRMRPTLSADEIYVLRVVEKMEWGDNPRAACDRGERKLSNAAFEKAFGSIGPRGLGFVDSSMDGWYVTATGSLTLAAITCAR
jgi:hypothetical protein